MQIPGTHADIDAIIVHYHAAALVREAIEALKLDAGSSGLSVNVIVADNGSTAEERALLQVLDVEYLPTGRDAGYAGGANFAFPRTRADYIILMNEDVMVLPGCLRTLRDALKDGAAVVGPEFYWDREKVFRLPATEERSRHNELLKVSGRRSAAKLAEARQSWREHVRRHWRSAEPMPSTAISGAMLAFRRDTWTKVGPWDEGYQLYFDENDWLFRVEAAGLQSIYVPAAKAFHLHNPKLAQDPDRLQWASESFVRFGSRYYGETFMRRLQCIGGRPSVLPAWVPLNANAVSLEIDIPSGYVFPLWVEVTPSPFGFPAAAARISDPSTRRWQLPAMKGLYFPAGTYYLQLVDDSGRELRSYAFQRRAYQNNG